jgi:hypothetical protein
MNEFQLQVTFKNQVVKFVDELIEQFTNIPEFVLIRIFVKDKIPIDMVIGRFIKEVLPFRNEIFDKEEKFFLENDAIYNSLGGYKEEYVKAIKDLWTSDTLDEENREVIWQWIHVLVRLAEKYKTNFGSPPGWE